MPVTLPHYALLPMAPHSHSKLHCTFNLVTTGTLAWSYQRVVIEGEHDRHILPQLHVIYYNGNEAFFRWKKDVIGGLTLSAKNSSRPFATYTPPSWPSRTGTLYFYPERIVSLTREDMALIIMFLSITMSTSLCFPISKPCLSSNPPVVYLNDAVRW
ncbi:hypothetical protein DSO57_1014605 [Entomophthora muscae]|uniref:Uncharacterized protein n=1 Tax=Entomophthora muscae TaxID=34485 RepID=A0ACC2UEA8_9FUNG|nr:hypothetical protein DSO57_1014605 [Entomophthora muscae]